MCKKYTNTFFCLNIITNKFNIGGNANILRAVEVSNGKYTWILADDDEYDFSECNDVFEMIIGGKVDLIHVGAHTDVAWDFGGRLETPRNLLKDGYPFFRFSSFVPCNIFKTASFYPYIVSGYDNIPNSYPHMPFLLSFFEKDKIIYLSQRQIVKAVIGNQRYSNKEFLVGWTNTACLLRTRKRRIQFFQDQFKIDTFLKKWFYPVGILKNFMWLKIEHPFIKFIDLYGILIFMKALFEFPLYVVYKIFKKCRKSDKILV
jgi:hypothetical protein